MRLTKFNPETGRYEYIAKPTEYVEYRALTLAALQKLGELEDRAEGRWVRHKECCLYNKCSLCSYEHCREDNYCPNCGARMKGADDEQGEMPLSGM